MANDSKKIIWIDEFCAFRESGNSDISSISRSWIVNRLKESIEHYRSLKD